MDALEVDEHFGTPGIRVSTEVVLSVEAMVQAIPFFKRLGKKVLETGRRQGGYGRTVGKVVIGGADANLEQVRAGLA